MFTSSHDKVPGIRKLHLIQPFQGVDTVGLCLNVHLAVGVSLIDILDHVCDDGLQISCLKFIGLFQLGSFLNRLNEEIESVN